MKKQHLLEEFIFFIITQHTDVAIHEILDSSNLNISVTPFFEEKVNYKTSYNLFLKRIPSLQVNCILFLNPKFTKLKKNFDLTIFKHNSRKIEKIVYLQVIRVVTTQ